MNIVESQEFARLAGIKSNHVATYIKRGKIVAEKIIGEGKGRRVLIDTDNAVNKSFILLKKTTRAKKELQESMNENPESLTVEEQIPVEDAVSDEVNDVGENNDEKPSNNPFLLDIQLKKAELKLRKQRAEANRITIDRAKRKLIPTDVVAQAVSEVVHRYKTSFVQGTDQIIRDAFNTIQADNKLLIETLSKLTDLANEVSHRTNIEARIAIENSMSDSLSQVR